jgi:serine/threonine protein kinase, bacterial
LAIYVADSDNHNIRKISTTGYVSTIAGSGSIGSDDGQGISASFDRLECIAVDSLGNLYVTDIGSSKIRRINTTGYVSTIAGTGSYGSLDGEGTAASFYFPLGIAVDSSDNLYVADSWNHKIRRVSWA